MNRLAGVDRLRGFAVVGMMAGHLAWLADAPTWVRTPGTRWVHLLLAIVAGLMFRPGWRRRHWWLVAAAALTGAIAADIRLAAPSVLVVLVLVLVVAQALHRWPVVFAIVAYIQAWYLPIPWAGFQPGQLALGLAMGMLARPRLELIDIAAYDLLPAWLELVGRRALRWYVGHMAALWLLVAVNR